MLTTELDTKIDIDISSVQKICGDLTSAIVDDKPGINEKTMKMLVKTRENLLKADEALMKLPETSSKQIDKQQIIDNLKEKGINTTVASPDEAYISIELLDALIATSNLINKTDPLKARNREYQGREYVDTATLANIEFLDFFIKIHKKFHFSNNEMESLCAIIFKEVGFDAELKRKALENFPGGVAAALRAYLEISRVLPTWDISAPTLELDKRHSVDLLAECSDGRKCYFDIKGKTVYEKVKIINITSDEKLENAWDKIDKGPGSQKQKEKDYDSISRLHMYVDNQRKKGGKSFAYFVQANSLF